jgi:hypothetical protein
MFFMKAHFDASGEWPLFAFGGYIGTRPQWKEFNRRWRPLLTTDGRVDVFHATDFEAGQKAFTKEKGWPRERRNEVRLKLATTLYELGFTGIVVTVNVKEYDEYMTGWRREKYGDAFTFCVEGCIKLLGLRLRYNNISQPIAAIVEAGDKGTGKVHEAFQRAFADPADRDFYRLGSLRFAPKDHVIALQAADMMAHYFWAYQMGRVKWVDPYIRILSDERMLWEHYDTAVLKRTIEEVPAPRIVDVKVEADFSGTYDLLSELDSLMETSADGAYALVKDAASVSKLIGVKMESNTAPAAKSLRLTFEPTDFARERMAALRALKGDGELSE